MTSREPGRTPISLTSDGLFLQLKDGAAGYAAIVRSPEDDAELDIVFGCFRAESAPDAEYLAITEGIEQIQRSYNACGLYDIVAYTDFQAFERAHREYMSGIHSARNRKTTDLWTRFMKRHPDIRLDVRWIPRKSGTIHHQMCDSLSRMAARTYARAMRNSRDRNAIVRLSARVNRTQLEEWSSLKTSLGAMLKRRLFTQGSLSPADAAGRKPQP